jgi:hypothetical protein
MDSKTAGTPAGTTAGTTPVTTAGTTPERSTLERELLDEMTSWPSRDRGGALKAWHRHSLSLVHLNVLTVIERLGPMPMRRLAEEMDVSDAKSVDQARRRPMPTTPTSRLPRPPMIGPDTGPSQPRLPLSIVTKLLTKS